MILGRCEHPVSRWLGCVGGLWLGCVGGLWLGCVGGPADTYDVCLINLVLGCSI